MPLTKNGVYEFIAGTPGTAGTPAATYCTPNPPEDGDSGTWSGGGSIGGTIGGGEGDTTEPVSPSEPPDPERERVYLYVPNNTSPGPGDVVIETRTPWFAPAPTGYTCTTGTYFLDDPNIPGGTVPVRETRCYWNY